MSKLAILIGVSILAQPPASPGTRADPPRTMDPAAATTRPSVERLNRLLATVRKEHRTPGLVAAVVTSDGLKASGADGKRAIGSREKVTPTDQFHLGSCTKSMTATLCAMLVERGKLTWDDTPAKTWPNLAPKLHAALRDITLKQLLCHRSGLPNDNAPDIKIWPKIMALTGDLRDQRKSFVEINLARPAAQEPGKGYAYSNAGFAIAGAMAEAATGESYESLMRSMLFQPLGMTSAGFGAPEAGQPLGHDPILGMYTPVKPGPRADNPQVIAPAGTVHCSVEDWARYAHLHLSAARGTSIMLTADSFEVLHSDPYKQDYGFGWAVMNEDWGGGPVLAHDGSNGRWYAVIVIAPKRDIAILVATNAADGTAQSACREAITAIRKRFLDMNPGEPTSRRSEDLPTSGPIPETGE